jgi:hypothetical protein
MRTQKNGKTTLFYDVASGLKVADSVVLELRWWSTTKLHHTVIIEKCKGVKVPYSKCGFDLDTNEREINEGVLATDFQ